MSIRDKQLVINAFRDLVVSDVRRLDQEVKGGKKLTGDDIQMLGQARSLLRRL